MRLVACGLMVLAGLAGCGVAEPGGGPVPVNVPVPHDDQPPAADQGVRLAPADHTARPARRWVRREPYATAELTEDVRLILACGTRPPPVSGDWYPAGHEAQAAFAQHLRTSLARLSARKRAVLSPSVRFKSQETMARADAIVDMFNRVQALQTAFETVAALPRAGDDHIFTVTGMTKRAPYIEPEVVIDPGCTDRDKANTNWFQIMKLDETYRYVYNNIFVKQHVDNFYYKMTPEYDAARCDAEVRHYAGDIDKFTVRFDSDAKDCLVSCGFASKTMFVWFGSVRNDPIGADSRDWDEVSTEWFVGDVKAGQTVTVYSRSFRGYYEFMTRLTGKRFPDAAVYPILTVCSPTFHRTWAGDRPR